MRKSFTSLPVKRSVNFSLYSSRYDSVSVASIPRDSRASRTAAMASRTARGTSPAFSDSPWLFLAAAAESASIPSAPNMVWVLPEPVWGGVGWE